MTTTMNTSPDTVNTYSKYFITVSKNNVEHYLYANSQGEIAAEINTLMGFPLLTKGIVVNWVSRGNKSKKYDYITVQYNTSRML
jgi:hypothetical protein